MEKLNLPFNIESFQACNVASLVEVLPLATVTVTVTVIENRSKDIDID